MKRQIWILWTYKSAQSVSKYNGWHEAAGGLHWLRKRGCTVIACRDMTNKING